MVCNLPESFDSLASTLGKLEKDFSEQAANPCYRAKHTVIDDPRRLTKEDGGNSCDNLLPQGWYRFLLNNTSAVIPARCIHDNSCHTFRSTWLDLQGQSLPAVGQKIKARACSTWATICCSWQTPITVLNCSRYFVYKLKVVSGCDHGYCVDPQA
ncbi:hypothetical protein ACOMHN_053295 [Nucella lapillus]